MKQVGPAFGKIFRWVAACVSGNEGILPVRNWPVVVAFLERCCVVFALVTKESTCLLEQSALSHQLLKIEVTDLVAKVSKQGSVGLSHRNTNGLANDVIGLGRSKTDQTAPVPSHRRADTAAFIDRIFQKVEDQTALRVDVSSGTRKAKAQNGIDGAGPRLFYETLRGPPGYWCWG